MTFEGVLSEKQVGIIFIIHLMCIVHYAGIFVYVSYWNNTYNNCQFFPPDRYSLYWIHSVAHSQVISLIAFEIIELH